MPAETHNQRRELRGTIRTRAEDARAAGHDMDWGGARGKRWRACLWATGKGGRDSGGGWGRWVVVCVWGGGMQEQALSRVQELEDDLAAAQAQNAALRAQLRALAAEQAGGLAPAPRSPIRNEHAPRARAAASGGGGKRLPSGPNPAGWGPHDDPGGRAAAREGGEASSSPGRVPAPGSGRVPDPDSGGSCSEGGEGRVPSPATASPPDRRAGRHSAGLIQGSRATSDSAAAAAGRRARPTRGRRRAGDSDRSAGGGSSGGGSDGSGSEDDAAAVGFSHAVGPSAAAGGRQSSLGGLDGAAAASRAEETTPSRDASDRPASPPGRGGGGSGGGPGTLLVPLEDGAELEIDADTGWAVGSAAAAAAVAGYRLRVL